MAALVFPGNHVTDISSGTLSARPPALNEQIDTLQAIYGDDLTIFPGDGESVYDLVFTLGRDRDDFLTPVKIVFSILCFEGDAGDAGDEETGAHISTLQLDNIHIQVLDKENHNENQNAAKSTIILSRKQKDKLTRFLLGTASTTRASTTRTSETTGDVEESDIIDRDSDRDFLIDKIQDIYNNADVADNNQIFDAITFAETEIITRMESFSTVLMLNETEEITDGGGENGGQMVRGETVRVGVENRPETDRIDRQWLLFIGFYTKSIIQHFCKEANSFGITGFLMPGKPAVALLEGPPNSAPNSGGNSGNNARGGITDFLKIIRTEIFAQVPREARKMEVCFCEERVGGRVFEEFEERRELQGNVGHGRKDLNDLGGLERFLEEKGLGHAFKALFEGMM